MNHPPRLIEQGADRFELAALRAAEVDVGSERALRRALAAVGATAALVTPATATAVIGKGAVALLVVKWMAAGAIVGATCTIGASAIHRHPSAAEMPAVPAGAIAPKREPAASSSERAMAPPATVVSLPTRSSARFALAKPPAPAASSDPETAQRLSREIALLDQARAALKRGDGAAAIAALDQRQAEVGAGMLGPEATVTRVEALLRQGDRVEASALAERFLAEHPRGVHADRLRTLLRGARP
jgi:hypothetical protein